MERLTAAVAKNDSSGGTTALFVMDVDQLKTVRTNSLAGWVATSCAADCDQAARACHESDTLARIGGDKFAIVQPHTGAPNRAQALASRMETAFAQGFVVDGQMVKASVSWACRFTRTMRRMRRGC